MSQRHVGSGFHPAPAVRFRHCAVDWFTGQALGHALPERGQGCPDSAGLLQPLRTA